MAGEAVPLRMAQSWPWGSQIVVKKKNFNFPGVFIKFSLRKTPKQNWRYHIRKYCYKRNKLSPEFLRKIMIQRVCYNRYKNHMKYNHTIEKFQWEINFLRDSNTFMKLQKLFWVWSLAVSKRMQIFTWNRIKDSYTKWAFT